MLDLALGFIIGAAFSGLVKSLAENLLMQLVAAMFGKPDFSTLLFTVNDAQIKGWFWGGRPGWGGAPAEDGSRPASASARRSRNSICALVLRNSSPAHLASASCTAGSSRSRTCLRGAITGTASRC